MNSLKKIFKRNTHTYCFKQLAGFGRALNRLYENRNHDIDSNGELVVQKKLSAFKPKVIVDGGANIGKYSKMLHKEHPDCIIYAFEPVKETYNTLLQNVGHLKNVVAINKGLFSCHCEKEIYLFNSNTHSSLFDIKGVASKYNNVQTIDLIRGDSYAKDNKLEVIDFLKLDLEGAEYDALLGFENLLREKKIKAIQFEYGYINITTRKLLIDFYELLNKYGYKVGKIFPKTVEFRPYNHKYEDFIGPNFIAVNDDEIELIRILENK
ncbi:FkbM family methyltransferase [Carboxylicivirga sp. M1479]|uniref:FkbM family methyltransferase n=1 Tax=Carboxylicivirga sp. M1479 TaxID=2594476 RepID=UPI0011786BDC|nr:FkbM family methyltransferase [Carboxylicivirga sp. M1479]TRX71250.1 FkbM family methyltransferase [Carboxylicivirga sp. M1479]